MQLIDTHCHLDFDDFSDDRQQLMVRAQALGVAHFVVPAVQQGTWQSLLTLFQQQQCVHLALGMHPLFMAEHKESHIALLDTVLQQQRPIAVGEIGLDFYSAETDRQMQLHFFRAQLQLAAKHKLPVILHVRKAHDEVLKCLREIPVMAGIVHAFNGSMQQAEHYVAMNFKLGFGGMLTYPRSTKLRTLAGCLSLDALVLETDSPDMTVMQHRGQRNSPEYLPYCLQALAELRGQSQEIIAEVTSANARQVLGIK